MGTVKWILTWMLQTCFCGCGEPVKLGKRFLIGHNRRKSSDDAVRTSITRYCQCGCGTVVRKRYVVGHNAQKGRKLSEETKKKIALAGTGRICSEATKQRLSEAHKGKIVSEETRDKLSKALKGIPAWNRGKKGCFSTETREKMSKAKKGRRLPESTKVKMSGVRKGHRGWNKGKTWTAEAKLKNSITHKTALHLIEMRKSPEYKKKLTEGLKRAYASGRKSTENHNKGGISGEYKGVRFNST